jgi:hypothetical protein
LGAAIAVVLVAAELRITIGVSETFGSSAVHDPFTLYSYLSLVGFFLRRGKTSIPESQN